MLPDDFSLHDDVLPRARFYINRNDFEKICRVLIPVRENLFRNFATCVVQRAYLVYL